MTLTQVQEEYLKIMYILEQTKKEIRVTDIAERLEKSKASVNSAINALKEEGVLEYEPYGKIELTDQGKKEARKIVEANDIVKLFLTEIVGIKEDVADGEAGKMKSALSDDSINKLARYTYKTLGLVDLNCGYDINNDNCVKCIRKK